jgi:hypothetical protein
MTKINRRDYLIRMGLGAGAIAGGSKLSLLARGVDDDSISRNGLGRTTDRTISSSKLLLWPITNTPLRRMRS